MNYVVDSYENYKEENRLTTNNARRIEFVTTTRVLWVTHGGSEKLEDRLCVRPTSETLFCEHYSNIIHSYRDLPKPST